MKSDVFVIDIRTGCLLRMIASNAELMGGEYSAYAIAERIDQVLPRGEDSVIVPHNLYRVGDFLAVEATT